MAGPISSQGLKYRFNRQANLHPYVLTLNFQKTELGLALGSLIEEGLWELKTSSLHDDLLSQG